MKLCVVVSPNPTTGISISNNTDKEMRRKLIYLLLAALIIIAAYLHFSYCRSDLYINDVEVFHLKLEIHYRYCFIPVLTRDFPEAGFFDSLYVIFTRGDSGLVYKDLSISKPVINVADEYYLPVLALAPKINSETSHVALEFVPSLWGKRQLKWDSGETKFIKLYFRHDSNNKLIYSCFKMIRIEQKKPTLL